MRAVGRRRGLPADGVGGAADVVQGAHGFVTLGLYSSSRRKGQCIESFEARQYLLSLEASSSRFPHSPITRVPCGGVAVTLQGRSCRSPARWRGVYGTCCCCCRCALHKLRSIENLICHEIRSSLVRSLAPFVDGAVQVERRAMSERGERERERAPPRQMDGSAPPQPLRSVGRSFGVRGVQSAV